MGEQTEVWPFDVFISCARSDTQPFGARIEVFFDTDSTRDGDQWRDRILKARL